MPINSVLGGNIHKLPLPGYPLSHRSTPAPGYSAQHDYSATVSLLTNLSPIRRFAVRLRCRHSRQKRSRAPTNGPLVSACAQRTAADCNYRGAESATNTVTGARDRARINIVVRGRAKASAESDHKSITSRVCNVYARFDRQRR